VAFEKRYEREVNCEMFAQVLERAWRERKEAVVRPAAAATRPGDAVWMDA
jgi:hypothetical protein